MKKIILVLPVLILILLIPLAGMTGGARHPLNCDPDGDGIVTPAELALIINTPEATAATEIDKIEKSPQLYPFKNARFVDGEVLYQAAGKVPNGVFDIQHELEVWNELNPATPCESFYEHLRDCDTNLDGVITAQELANWFIFYDVWVYPVDHTEKKMRLFEQSVADRIPLAAVGNIWEAFLDREADVNGQFDKQAELWYWSAFVDTVNISTYSSPLGGIPYCEPLEALVPEPPDPPVIEKELLITGDKDGSGSKYTVIVDGEIRKGPRANSNDKVSEDMKTAIGGVIPTGSDNYFFTGNIVSITATTHVFTFVNGIEIPNDSPPLPPVIPETLEERVADLEERVAILEAN